MTPASTVLTPARALGLALALSMGAAVSLGITRFSYGLLLPVMRDDLGWRYALAGGMNTANAVGYLLGALLVPAVLQSVAGVAHGWEWAWWALALASGVATMPLVWAARAMSDAGGAAATASSHGGAALPVELRRLGWALGGYTLFGAGYIGYMTFVIALLREQGASALFITVFYALLGVACLVSSRLWAGLPTATGWIADGDGGLARGLVASALTLWLGAALASRQRALDA